jgi:hypothetical protein
VLLNELMQGAGNFAGVGCAPGNDALEFDEIVGNGADFRQLGFDYLRIAHSPSAARRFAGVGPARQVNQFLLSASKLRVATARFGDFSAIENNAGVSPIC